MMRAILLSLGLLLAACQTPTTYTPSVTPEELAREEALQQQLVEEAAARGGEPRPWQKRPGISKQFERVAAAIDQAGADLCREMNLPGRTGARCYYYFSLSQDDDLNAHADGKKVVIYSGMMRFLKDDDEVAIVLAHELAHNLMGHVDSTRQNMIAGAVLGGVIDAVATSQGVNTGGGMMDVGASAAQLAYSIEFEEEADYVGLYIAARAGYDISKAPNLWRRMTLEDPRGLFREVTHPSNTRRAAALSKAVYEINYKRNHGIALLPDWKVEG
jgi:predicted Zn-dependent protease